MLLLVLFTSKRKVYLFGCSVNENMQYSIVVFTLLQNSIFYVCVPFVCCLLPRDKEHMSRLMSNPVFGVSDQVQHKPSCTTRIIFLQKKQMSPPFRNKKNQNILNKITNRNNAHFSSKQSSSYPVKISCLCN